MLSSGSAASQSDPRNGNAGCWWRVTLSFPYPPLKLTLQGKDLRELDDCLASSAIPSLSNTHASGLPKTPRSSETRTMLCKTQEPTSSTEHINYGIILWNSLWKQKIVAERQRLRINKKTHVSFIWKEKLLCFSTVPKYCIVPRIYLVTRHGNVCLELWRQRQENYEFKLILSCIRMWGQAGLYEARLSPLSTQEGKTYVVCYPSINWVYMIQKAIWMGNYTGGSRDERHWYF